MADRLDKLLSNLAAIAARPTVPLPDPSSARLYARDGWEVYAKNGLWSDEPNLEGDLQLVTPTGRILGATWDVSGSGTPSTDFLDDPHLQVAMHFSVSVENWGQLVTEVLRQIPAIASHYDEAEHSDGSPAGDR